MQRQGVPLPPPSERCLETTQGQALWNRRARDRPSPVHISKTRPNGRATARVACAGFILVPFVINEPYSGDGNHISSEREARWPRECGVGSPGWAPRLVPGGLPSSGKDSDVLPMNSLAFFNGYGFNALIRSQQTGLIWQVVSKKVCEAVSWLIVFYVSSYEISKESR